MSIIYNPEYPRPDLERANWKNLNGEWDFELFEAGTEDRESAFAKARDNYSGRITVPFSWTCPLSGIGKNVPGIGWYRTEAAFECEGRVFLCFGAVDYFSEIYINGVLAAKHQGGYSQIDIDVTDLWKPGRNVIEVRAEDYQKETQPYGKQAYSDIQGIWQTVWLEERPAERIEKFRFVTKCSGLVTLTAETTAADGTVLTAAFGGKSFEGTVCGGRATVEMRFESPRLWSTEDPYLYEGTLTLGTDTVKTYFGIREIGAAKFDGRDFKWITVNGKPVYINATLDQAFHDKGHFTYPSDAAMRDEAWRLKRLGLNAVRIHIKSEMPRKLYWMDKLGVMVIADIPCFWSDPTEEAREYYALEWPRTFARDFNHPSIFQWVLFNETWGLFTNKDDRENREYTKETQEWVLSVWKAAKENDPTRLIEDNSPCNYDHIKTDINTWHFYLNGYETVKDHIDTMSDHTFVGSGHNYVPGCKQDDAPLMNSECGMVWGVDGSAGDSDLSWQYRYMLNEFRLHEKICGFVFTEFHDVINEFNGYYRIDDTDKDWGYQDLCRGMTLRDLHAADFLCLDCPPCRTMGPGEAAAVPMALSSFSEKYQASGLVCEWELWHDGLDGRVSDGEGSFAIAPFGYGKTDLGDITVRMPKENAVAVLSVYLKTLSGEVISRNFTTFDVRCKLPGGMTEASPAAMQVSGTRKTWRAHGGEKLSVAARGSVTVDLALPEGEINGLNLYFEAGSKRLLSKDEADYKVKDNTLDFMRGARLDRGKFLNSYFMTDEDAHVSEAEVFVDDVKIGRAVLENDYSDCRGVLSFHNQPNNRRLDEAGSYGQLFRFAIPSRLLPSIIEKGSLTLTLRCKDGGMAIYGRNSGRYPVGLTLRAW